MEHQCLNCGHDLHGSYCCQCGQKSNTHRLSIRHFVEHDLIHGIWHLDKGIFFTLKHILTRPGHLAGNYIAGKRAGHFNLVTLLVFVVGFFVASISAPQNSLPEVRYQNNALPGLIPFMAHAAKWLLLLLVPVFAKASSDMFSKLQYNFAEHLVMNGFFVAGVFCIMLFFRPFYFIPALNNLVLLGIELLCLVSYLVYAYRQVAQAYYTAMGFLFRMMAFFLAVTFYMIGVVFGIASTYTIWHLYILN